jgi:hypothetical protein
VLFSSVAHFFIGSLIWGEFSFWAPCIFWSSVLWYIAGECFLLLCGWSLQFRDHFFFCAEAFQFHVVPFVQPFS